MTPEDFLVLLEYLFQINDFANTVMGRINESVETSVENSGFKDYFRCILQKNYLKFQTRMYVEFVT